MIREQKVLLNSDADAVNCLPQSPLENGLPIIFYLLCFLSVLFPLRFILMHIVFAGPKHVGTLWGPGSFGAFSEAAQ